jgi:hypothetical protein
MSNILKIISTFQHVSRLCPYICPIRIPFLVIHDVANLLLPAQPSPLFLKNSVFWNKTPYRQPKVKQRFGGTCHFDLQGRKEVKKKKAARSM